jgi:glyoxylate/hydroxypyruvate reductase A
MGLGTLGLDAAAALAGLGFRVAGWSASAKQIEGIESYHGGDGFEPFLKRTSILVCLLPLTPQTRHIINRRTLSMLDSTGPLGAPVLINAGRGALQNEADILACLNDGTLGAATLDVFEAEPLPADSPLWQHPNVIVTPHNAADTDPEEISRYVAAQIARFEAGGELENVVDLSRGY